MKKIIKKIIISILLISVMVSISFVVIDVYRKYNKQSSENNLVEQAKITENKEDVMIIDLGKKDNQNTTENETQTDTGTDTEIDTKTENEKTTNQQVKNSSSSVNETEPTRPEPIQDAANLTQQIYNIEGIIGKLYIPKTKLNTDVYSSVVVSKLEKMPCFLYTTGGLSNTGITLIVGHNRRNGKMFSNNKKLNVGDIFYFTDLNGTKLKYTIYSKFTTTEDDISFLNNEVNKPVIALSCCTDASNEYRLILLGKAD